MYVPIKGQTSKTAPGYPFQPSERKTTHLPAKFFDQPGYCMDETI